MVLNKLLLFIFTILLIGFVSADLGTVRQNECIQVKTILNTTLVNISTISYPNQSISISNQPMIKLDKTFYYDYCNTSQIGVYNYDYYDVEGNTYVNSFEVTPTGTRLTTSQGLIYCLAFVIGLFIFLLFLFFTGRIEWTEKRDEMGYITGLNHFRFLKIFFASMSYVVLVWICFLAWNITYGFLNFQVASGFFRVLFLGMAWMIIPIFILSLYYSLVTFLTDKNLQTKINRGLSVK